MKHKLRNLYDRLLVCLASRKFFWGVVLLLILEAAWIAISGRYPMAFDEDFHFGIIKLYAQQWSPFFAHQPTGSDALGAVTRDPSYMYHYLMGFVYRITNGLWHDDFLNILILRFWSIGFLAAGLIVYRRVLMFSKLSPALIHTVCLFFVLTPLTPLVAAQMNYENLFVLSSGICFWLSFRLLRQLRERRQVDGLLLLAVLTVGMFTSLVKYAFLPILTVLVVYVAYAVWRTRVSDSRFRWWHSAISTFRAAAKPLQLGVAGAFVLLCTLFGLMYGYNVVQYHTPTPECDQVLSIVQCKAYGAWNRNYQYTQQHPHPSRNPARFTFVWAGTYLYSFSFAVNGAFSGFFVASPLPLLYWGTFALLLAAALAVAWHFRRIFRQEFFAFFGLLLVAYGGTLWLQNYSDYLHLGRHVAEQGRYLLVLLLPLYLVLAYGLKLAFEHRPQFKPVLLGLTMIVFLQGGGALTYIIRTDPSWWWEHNSAATSINRAAQRILRPVIIEEPVVNYHRFNGS